MNCDRFQPATKRTISSPLKSLNRVQSPYEQGLENILRFRALAGGSAHAASNRGEQAFSKAVAQLFERLLIATSGTFDELLFLSFVIHGCVHFIHISIEPPKTLAESKIKPCGSSKGTAARLAIVYRRERPATPDRRCHGRSFFRASRIRSESPPEAD